MKSENPSDSGRDDLQPIPEALQDISTEELVEADYEVVLSSFSEEDESPTYDHYGPVVMSLPGRMRNDDSIGASSVSRDRTSQGHAYSAGYDSPMATRIGDENSNDSKAERLRQLHEGRHRSDGQHSVRESQRDKKRISQAICSALPLTQHERRKVVNVVENLDLTRFGQQKGLTRVTLGAVAVVVDEQHRQVGDEVGEIVSWTETFRDICEEHDVSMSDLSTVKKKAREGVGQKTNLKRRDPALPGPTPTDEIPESYWENREPEYWTGVAKGWERTPNDHKEALPNEYQYLVERLCHWKPWSEEDDNDEPATTVEKVTVSDEESSDVTLKNLDEEIEAEAEKLLSEMVDEESE